MKVFKFGGASVRDADGIRNLAHIVRQFPDDDLIIVVSAMAKTTNALEAVVGDYCEGRDFVPKRDALRKWHDDVLAQVATDRRAQAQVASRCDDLDRLLERPPSGDVDRDYDRIVSQGEIWSTAIVSAHLAETGVPHAWVDARTRIRTDDTWRNARIDWEASASAAANLLDRAPATPRRIVTQGFIGGTAAGESTTIGREGSDFSAAIFAYLLDAESVVIWKDVPGMFNADPKIFPDARLLEHISYKEAIELSYFGASVIHPRTLQPLQRKNIPLYVRSFVDLTANGSTISQSSDHDASIPSFILKPNQILISITPRDLSFIVEENLSDIFAAFAAHAVRINIMQNSAVAFTACVDSGPRVSMLIDGLRRKYEVRWNENLELLTVRYPDDQTLAKLTAGREILLEQRSRATARFVLR
jgi:aspartate kinase